MTLMKLGHKYTNLRLAQLIKCSSSCVTKFSANIHPCSPRAVVQGHYDHRAKSGEKPHKLTLIIQGVSELHSS